MIVIIVIAVIGLLVWAGFAYHKDNNGGGATPGLAPCSQNIDISNLIQLGNTGNNCVQNGATGSLYYLGNIGTESYDYVVAPWTTQPLDVCISYCTGFSGGVCTGATSQGKSAQENFNNCMAQLSSTSCIPPKPLAANGTIIYYAYSPTCSICDNCQ